MLGWGHPAVLADILPNVAYVERLPQLNTLWALPRNHSLCSHVSSFKSFRECYALLEKCWTLWTNAASFECKINDFFDGNCTHRISFKGHPGRAIYSSESFLRRICAYIVLKECFLHIWKEDCHFPFFKWGNPTNKKREHKMISTSINSSGKEWSQQVT